MKDECSCCMWGLIYKKTRGGLKVSPQNVHVEQKVWAKTPIFTNVSLSWNKMNRYYSCPSSQWAKSQNYKNLVHANDQCIACSIIMNIVRKNSCAYAHILRLCAHLALRRTSCAIPQNYKNLVHANYHKEGLKSPTANRTCGNHSPVPTYATRKVYIANLHFSFHNLRFFVQTR